MLEGRDNSANTCNGNEVIFDQNWKLWHINDNIRIFKSTDAHDHSVMFKFSFNVEAKMKLIQEILRNVNEYHRWISPLQNTREVVTVDTEEISKSDCSSQCIIAEAKVDIIKSAIGRIGFTNNIISDLFQNLISVPVKYIVQQKESNSKTTQTVTTTIKSTKQKGMISKIIPCFSIKVICESFKTTNVVYINILAQVGCNSQTILAVNDAKLRQSNVMNSKSNQNCQSEPSMMIINEMIKSLTNLKSYIKLVEFEDTQAHQFKIHYHNIAKNTSNEGIKSKSNNESVQFKRQIEKEVRLVADDHDENSKQMDTSSHEDDSAHDIEAENDVNVMNVRESIHNRNCKKYSDLNEIDKVIDLEENGKEETKGMTSDQEDLVSKYFIDGEWTKWVPERCTPEEKEIFDKFKERLENYLVEANPRALKEEVTDNLILRFLSSQNFENPEESFK